MGPHEKNTTYILLLNDGEYFVWYAQIKTPPLLKAVCEGSLTKIKLHFFFKIDADQANDIGMTPLMAAAQKGYVDIAKYLIEKGADVNALACVRFPLGLAAQEGHKEMVELLLDNKADINLQDDEGWTALMKAVRYGHKEIVVVLLEKGANPHLRDINDLSARSWARVKKTSRDFEALALRVR